MEAIICEFTWCLSIYLFRNHNLYLFKLRFSVFEAKIYGYINIYIYIYKYKQVF